MSKDKLFEHRIMNSNGKEHHFIRIDGEENWKLHCWDGPAVRPLVQERGAKKEWYLFGIQYTEDEFRSSVRDREGLPWYKNPAMTSPERQ